jgi:hypothetical protein
MRSYEMPCMRKEFLADELSAGLEKGQTMQVIT